MPARTCTNCSEPLLREDRTVVLGVESPRHKLVAPSLVPTNSMQVCDKSSLEAGHSEIDWPEENDTAELSEDCFRIRLAICLAVGLSNQSHLI